MVANVCDICGSHYMATLRQTARTCSRSCAAKAMWRRRGATPVLPPGDHFYGGRWWKHYPSGRRHPSVERVCEGCGETFRCSENHLRSSRFKRPGRFCSNACSAIVRGREMAGTRKNGYPPAGAVKENQHGYLLQRVAADDPFVGMARRGGWVLQHRLVMARAIDRPLTREQNVHHINGDKHDNRLENLQLLSGPHGRKQAACCADCGSTNIVFEELAYEGAESNG